ncbi:hypothetical protein N9D23_10810 [Rubripirellula sp.]|nr:hypothetical protein [Rubripirellula sp.]
MNAMPGKNEACWNLLKVVLRVQADLTWLAGDICLDLFAWSGLPGAVCLERFAWSHGIFSPRPV